MHQKKVKSEKLSLDFIRGSGDMMWYFESNPEKKRDIREKKKR